MVNNKKKIWVHGDFARNIENTQRDLEKMLGKKLTMVDTTKILANSTPKIVLVKKSKKRVKIGSYIHV